MTFEEWWNSMEIMFIGHTQLTEKDIAEAAWIAARAGPIQLLRDFDRLVSKACPDASMYCDDGGLADQLDNIS